MLEMGVTDEGYNSLDMFSDFYLGSDNTVYEFSGYICESRFCGNWDIPIFVAITNDTEYY